MIRVLAAALFRAAALFGAAALLLAAPVAVAGAEPSPTRSSDAFFDYFYIEANEGGSSGGHAGIRFGDDTYHFQYASSGLLTLSRVDSADFLFEYTLLQNRSVHVSRVAVDVGAFEALRRAFGRRYLSQRDQLRRLRELRESRRLLESLALSKSREWDGVDVPVAGYFAPAEPAESPLGPLRKRLLKAHGEVGFEARRRQLTVDGLMAGGGPDFARRLDEWLAARTALGLLERGGRLHGDALRGAPLPELALSVSSIERLRLLEGALADRLVGLFRSQRPDWGTAFMTGAARWLAVRTSIERASLVVLDTYPADATSVLPEGGRWREAAPDLLRASRHRFQAALGRMLRRPGEREMDYARMEALANRYLELRGSAVEGRPMRVTRERLLPTRPASSRPLGALGGLGGLGGLGALGRVADLRRGADVAAAREAVLRSEIERAAGYHVVTDNCVTAIFETLDEGLGDLAGDRSAGAIERESRLRLGGRVEPLAGLGFVPFVSSRQVRAELRVVDAFTIDSLRTLRLAALRESEPAWRVHLREANVLTSTLYEGSDDDSVFVFFTEDALLLRPLYGALNLTVGLGASVAGLFAAPFDRAQLLRDGLQGALVSVPELFFVNIRKGSNPVVLPSEEPDFSRSLSPDELREDAPLAHGSQATPVRVLE